MYFMATSSVDDAIYRAERAEQRHHMRSATSRRTNRMAPATVQIRFEILQDICQTIAVKSPAMSTSPHNAAAGYVLHT
jgi:hypothetical protein